MSTDAGNSASVTSRRRQRFVRRLSLALNIVAVCLAVRFLFYPAGKALFLLPDGGALLIFTLWGLLVGAPLSFLGLLSKETRLAGIVNLVLSLAPVPLYWLIFALINETKHFTFW